MLERENLFNPCIFMDVYFLRCMIFGTEKNGSSTWDKCSSVEWEAPVAVDKKTSMVKGSLNQGPSERWWRHRVAAILMWSPGLLWCFPPCKPGSLEEVNLSHPRIIIRTDFECILRLSDLYPKYLQPEEFPNSVFLFLFFLGLEVFECM